MSKYVLGINYGSGYNSRAAFLFKNQNVKGEPIVDLLSDAINWFFNTELIFFIVGNYLIPNKFIKISQDLDINKIVKT